MKCLIFLPFICVIGITNVLKENVSIDIFSSSEIVLKKNLRWI
jgi:hypothetical protein